VELFPHQEKALLSKRRFIGLIGGTGGGKTFFGPIWLSCEIAEAPEDQFMVVAPTYKLMTRATLPALQECFRGTCLQGELNISSGLYKLPHGGRIWLGTADRPESLEAGQYRAAWLDEAGQMKYMAWVAIQARLGLKRGRCLLTTTPYGMNWLYKNFYQLWRKGHRDYDVVSFESTDNPLYPKEEVERAKAELSPELFDMRYRGLFRKMEGLVYPDFHDDHICEPFEIPDSWDRRGGCDFGYINPHVNLKGALDPREDVLYVYEEYYGSRKELKEIAETMYDVPWLGDPEGRREIEDPDRSAPYIHLMSAHSGRDRHLPFRSEDREAVEAGRPLHGCLGPARLAFRWCADPQEPSPHQSDTAAFLRVGRGCGCGRGRSKGSANHEAGETTADGPEGHNRCEEGSQAEGEET